MARAAWPWRSSSSRGPWTASWTSPPTSSPRSSTGASCRPARAGSPRPGVAASRRSSPRAPWRSSTSARARRLPERFDGPERRIVDHSASVTSVRSTAAEAAEIGARFAERVNVATGPTVVLLPLGGCSKYELPGGPFVDPEADAALFGAIRAGLRPDIPCHDVTPTSTTTPSSMPPPGRSWGSGSDATEVDPAAELPRPAQGSGAVDRRRTACSPSDGRWTRRARPHAQDTLGTPALSRRSRRPPGPRPRGTGWACRA